MTTRSRVQTSARPDEGEVVQALARSGVYRLLGRAFAHPSASTVAVVAEAAEQAARAADPSVAAKLRDLAAAARGSVPEEVARAYVVALEMPGGCAPYEGSYGTAPLLAGKGATLADIAGFYAAFGMTAAAAELEDHIAAELEFMSVLALKEAAALAEGLPEGAEITRAAAMAFLRDHLGRWAASFAAALAALGAAPFYARAVELLAAWLAADMERLDLAVAPVGARPTAGRDEARPFSCPMADEFA
jgi:DMSO reductase family type II enzyme chaperone